MTFAHEGNKTSLDGLVNFEKMHMMAQTMRTIRFCRSRHLGKCFHLLYLISRINLYICFSHGLLQTLALTAKPQMKFCSFLLRPLLFSCLFRFHWPIFLILFLFLSFIHSDVSIFHRLNWYINEIITFSTGSTVTKKWGRYSCIRCLFSSDWKPKTIDNNVTENRAQPKAINWSKLKFSFVCAHRTRTFTHTHTHPPYQCWLRLLSAKPLTILYMRREKPHST